MWPPIFGRILSYYYIPIVIDRNTQILTKSVVCKAEAKKKEKKDGIILIEMAVCQTAPNLFGGCVFEGIPKWRGGGISCGML